MGGAIRSGTAELVPVKNSIAENQNRPAPALKCFFVNAQGLTSKTDILKNYVDKLKLDIIAIAETFLNVEVLQTEVSIDGYSIYKKDRCNFKEGKAGAGRCNPIYYK